MVVGFDRKRLTATAPVAARRHTSASACARRLPACDASAHAPQATQRQALDVRLHPMRPVHLGLQRPTGTIRAANCCAGSAAAPRRNEAGFSALSNTDEDAGGQTESWKNSSANLAQLGHQAAAGHYPHAAVKLADVEKTAGILFRAFGGDPGLKVAAATVERMAPAAAGCSAWPAAAKRSRRPGAMPKPCACRRKSPPSRKNR
jgi:hypothetical protein